MALDSWSEGFDPKSLNGFSSPTWVRLPHVPLQYWGVENLSCITAMLGDLLLVDDTTLNWSRLVFASICVRLDFAKKLPKGVWIEGNVGKFFQPVVYEGLSKLCFSCGFVGHIDVDCPSAKRSPPPPQSAPPLLPTPPTTNPQPLIPPTIPLSSLPPPLQPPITAPQTTQALPHLPPLPSLKPQHNVQPTLNPKHVVAPSKEVEEIGYGPWTLYTRKKSKANKFLATRPSRWGGSGTQYKRGGSGHKFARGALQPHNWRKVRW